VSSTTLAATALRAAGALDRRWGGALALRVFFVTRPRMRVAPDAVGIMRDARHEHMVVDGRRVNVASWGVDGPLLVLLHGWRGRASQFAPLVPALRADGYRIIAPDVAAHGGSQGGRVDVRDWLAVLAELQRRHGRFRSVIGHSFGGFAALTAARLGLETDTVVSLAAPGRPAVFLDEFARMMRLDGAARDDLERRFLARLGDTPATFDLRYDGIAHPLAPSVPLLIVHGARDRQVPLAASRELAEATLGARLEVVPDAGHTRVIGHLATVEAVLAHLAIAPVSAMHEVP
jgi:pimeloyl-ACP methyl ester carboxylesterase